ncbi:hypothetical protein BCA33_16120 [Marinobacter sp. AC-23]|nr:hypothetical protein BCA33_16120 [Marinobacter sp. AC-23]
MSNLDQPPTAAEVAAYFQGNEQTDYQARMIRECGQRLKTYPFERVVANPYLLACHHRFCPDCQRRRAGNWASALRAVIDEESRPASKTDLRLGPHWAAIKLPGVPCDTSELANQLGILRLEVNQTTGQEAHVTPTFTCLVNLTPNLFNAQTQGKLVQRVRHDWIKPTNLGNWPGVHSCLIPTATKRDRDILQRKVSRIIETCLPYLDPTTFLDIVEQMKGVKTVVMHRSQRTLFKPSQTSQADDLRYEREYSVSRIGEDLPESTSGNRGLELLPWSLKAQLKAR